MSHTSKWISEIGWDIKTLNIDIAGTNTPISVEILRDNALVIALWVEPGSTSRLDRGDSRFYFFRFQGANFAPDDSDVGHSIGGQGRPYGVEFPEDIGGHLQCRFGAWGEDMWIKDNIEAYVRYTRLRSVPGTIDSTIWVDDLNWTHVGSFTEDARISRDTAEGFRTWTLVY